MNNKVFQKGIKRFFDIVTSLITLVLFMPIGVLIALFIKITSPGPVFFIQDRPGYKRDIFKIYKFRTMKLGSEKMVKGKEVLGDDPRITGIGKVLRRTKIDEIPQLINVIKGDMSLVGPRPERIASLDDYTEVIEMRLDMKPGMTGLAQVSGNIYLSLEERYDYDVYYVENYSIWLDIKIILRTIGVVILGEERYINKHLIIIKQEDSGMSSKKEGTVSK